MVDEATLREDYEPLSDEVLLGMVARAKEYRPEAVDLVIELLAERGIAAERPPPADVDTSS